LDQVAEELRQSALDKLSPEQRRTVLEVPGFPQVFETDDHMLALVVTYLQNADVQKALINRQRELPQLNLSQQQYRLASGVG
jgi:hypothetical protein